MELNDRYPISDSMTNEICLFKIMLSKLQVPFSHVKWKYSAEWIMKSFSTAIISSPANIKQSCECKDPNEMSYCNVALIGADSKLGELTALLIKQNPLISSLHLQGGATIEGLKTDLSHIDTRCRVVAHSGTDNYRNAMKTADIIVLLGMGGFSKQTSIGDRVMTEETEFVNWPKNVLNMHEGQLS
ncbi:hypothetical protein WA026_010812 [Henosepilachna vigintioctopunctata]|uniref:Malate dehydrogenase, mitochondrial n=1 Tax=Henosepilachna vigintioctopunctata TaxID=420089 RepID=A0AAW1UQ58_9CUCU